MTRILQSNHIQPFAFTAPEATSVQLVGDFTHWLRDPINLRMSAKGIWKTNVPLARGTHRYKFLVNGQWHDGPEYVIRVANFSVTNGNPVHRKWGPKRIVETKSDCTASEARKTQKEAIAFGPTKRLID